MKDKVVEHLKFIQDTINRMAKHSFSIKEATILINVAVFAFAGQANNKASIISIIPTIIMWGLDSYYLLQEKKFRLLYDYVRSKNDTDFDMNYNNLNIKLNKVNKYTFINTFFSVTELFFYLGLLITVSIIYFYPFK